MSSIKEKLKKAALRASIFLAGISFAQQASAQDTQDKKIDSHEVKWQKPQQALKVMDEDIFAYFYQNGINSGIKIEKDTLIKSLKDAQINQDQASSFAKNYAASLDKNGEINLSDFIDAMEQSGFSNEQMSTVTKSLASQDQQIKKENVNLEQNLFSHTVKTDDGIVSYGVDKEGQFFVKGSVSMETASLMPDMYYDEGQNLYICGPVKGAKQSVVRSIVSNNLRTIALNQIAYEDIKARETNGENIHDSEHNFVEQHLKRMKEYNLGIKQGKLQKNINPQQVTQIKANRGR